MPGGWVVDKFCAAEQVYIVSLQAQISFFGHHRGLPAWVDTAVVVDVVLLAIAFDDHAGPVRQEQEESPSAGATLGQGHGVPDQDPRRRNHARDRNG